MSDTRRLLAERLGLTPELVDGMRACVERVKDDFTDDPCEDCPLVAYCDSVGVVLDDEAAS